MAQDLLLDIDITNGRELVEALKAGGMDVRGAYWLYVTDIEQWKLQVVTGEASEGSTALYAKALKVSRDFDFLGRVQFVSPSSAVFQGLSGLGEIGVKGRRVSRSVFNGVYVDDAFVYPMAA